MTKDGKFQSRFASATGRVKRQQKEIIATLTLAPETEARLLAAAAQTGLAPEKVIDNPLRQDTSKPVQDTPEQARLRAAFFELIAEASALEPIPAEERSDQAPEEQMHGETITEKYRKQGFNL